MSKEQVPIPKWLSEDGDVIAQVIANFYQPPQIEKVPLPKGPPIKKKIKKKVLVEKPAKRMEEFDLGPKIKALDYFLIGFGLINIFVFSFMTKPAGPVLLGIISILTGIVLLKIWRKKELREIEYMEEVEEEVVYPFRTSGTIGAIN